jgi:hypothetical protein
MVQQVSGRQIVCVVVAFSLGIIVGSVAPTNPVAPTMAPKDRSRGQFQKTPGKNTKPLYAQLQILNLNEKGYIPIPASFDLVIEIGANSRNTMDQEWLPTNKDHFLLTFEPLLDKYATLLSRNSQPDWRSALGFHHARGIVLPFAISPGKEEYQTFNLAGMVDGCASLLKSAKARFHPECASIRAEDIEKRRVPSVSLEKVLREWIDPNVKVAFVKIDAQGFDLQVFLSAGKQMKRIKSVHLEMTKDTCPRMYEGAPSCSEAVAEMTKQGYTADKACATAPFKEAGGCEDNFIFTRG